MKLQATCEEAQRDGAAETAKVQRLLEAEVRGLS